ncbi:hypothetical protein Y032_0599g482 [Ancylostoma ceylanicum]|nr:hypothetical protein Y032_0599g482 [Ancylostoma ceylanicum]
MRTSQQPRNIPTPSCSARRVMHGRVENFNIYLDLQVFRATFVMCPGFPKESKSMKAQMILEEQEVLFLGVRRSPRNRSPRNMRARNRGYSMSPVMRDFHQI